MQNPNLHFNKISRGPTHTVKPGSLALLRVVGPKPRCPSESSPVNFRNKAEDGSLFQSQSIRTFLDGEPFTTSEGDYDE